MKIEEKRNKTKKASKEKKKSRNARKYETRKRGQKRREEKEKRRRKRKERKNGRGVEIDGAQCLLWLGSVCAVLQHAPFKSKFVQVIIVGVILGWATGLNKSEDVDAAADLVKW